MNPHALREAVIPLDTAAPLVRVQPQGLYAYFCRELALKPNTAVIQRLRDVCLLCPPVEPHVITPSTVNNQCVSSASDVPVEASEDVAMTEGCCSSSHLNLSQNFLGAEGLRPLLQTIRVVHFFTTIDLSDNVLDSQMVAEIVRYLDGVISLQTLLLSRNPLISHSGGRHVKAFVATNANICAVDLSGSSVSGALQKTIDALCLANRRLRQQPELLEEKLSFQRRVRGSHGSSAGSLQPTPLKRHMPEASMVAPQHAQNAHVQSAPSNGDHRVSAARSDSLLVVDASDGGSIAVMPTTTLNVTAAAATLNHNTGTGVLLPPFHHMEIPTPGRAGGPPGGGEHHSLERDDGGMTSGTGTSSSNHATQVVVEGAQLEPIQYVFATALSGVESPQPGGQHGIGGASFSSAAPAAADPFAALRLLRDVMYETE